MATPNRSRKGNNLHGNMKKSYATVSKKKDKGSSPKSSSYKKNK